MILAMDIGNSHILFGGFSATQPTTTHFVASIATDAKQTGEQYACTLRNVLSLHGVDTTAIAGVVLCTVVPSMVATIQHALSFVTTAPILQVGAGVKTGLNIRIDQPRTLGSDRVAAAAYATGAVAMPCVIVDMGTATSFTVLDASGALVGSAITAGVGISLRALKEHAAQLPAVGLEAHSAGTAEIAPVLGKSTADAIRAGMLHGAAAMVEGMLARFAATLGQQPTVLLTGGSAALIQPYLAVETTYEPHVSLLGLVRIWQRQRG